MLTLNIGPLALAVHHVLILGSLLLAMLCGWRVGRRQRQNPEKQLFRLLLVALVTARLSFVAMYFKLYQEQPWSILDIRDGGFMAWPGLLTAALYGGWMLYKTPALRKPLGAAMVIGLLSWSAGSLTLHWLERDSRLPDLVLMDINGQPVNLQSYQDKALVINLWATWCPPCRREMPVLVNAQARYPQITFLFVNQGETPVEINHFLQSQGLRPDNVLLDSSGQLGTLAGSSALPTTLFYDRTGRKIGNHLGELSQASLEHALRELK